nr:MAG TPA: hypothetical protein [Caudoviricetes sp.]DAP45414.1 MAG TPA: hypothetical protein [Caudoviricetes sp.]
MRAAVKKINKKNNRFCSLEAAGCFKKLPYGDYTIFRTVKAMESFQKTA